MDLGAERTSRRTQPHRQDSARHVGGRRGRVAGMAAARRRAARTHGRTQSRRIHGFGVRRRAGAGTGGGGGGRTRALHAGGRSRRTGRDGGDFGVGRCSGARRMRGRRAGRGGVGRQFQLARRCGHVARSARHPRGPGAAVGESGALGGDHSVIGAARSEYRGRMLPGQGAHRFEQAYRARHDRAGGVRSRESGRSADVAGKIRRDDMSLANEIALATGATRGIGRAIALELGRAGATVIGTATSAAGADDISAYLGDSGVKGRGMRLDVTDAASVETVMAAIQQDYGAPGILVNNAGITRDNLLMRMKDEEWDEIIDTNLTSVFRLSKACLRGMMKARKGRIISIASVVGATGNPGQVNYAAAKAGIMGFTKALAREVASRSITVNTVAPGFIDTDMTRVLPEEQKQGLLQQIPLQRLGAGEEIAAAVAFLASPQAAYITGQTLHVNGGMYMS